MGAGNGVRTCLRAVAAALIVAAVAAGARASEGAAVAVVGGQPILAADLEGYLTLRAAGGATVEALRKRLEEMIASDVLYQEALRLGVDREPAVRQTLRQILAQRLLEREVERPVAERKIGEEELKAYYEGHLQEFNRPEQVRVADVFYAAPEGGDPGVRKSQGERAAKAHAEALALQDARFGFGELVLRDSDTHPAYPRGDTGFFDREGRPAGVPPALAAAAFAVPRAGVIAPQVVATPEGFHVIMLTGKRDALARKLEDEAVRAEIEGRIRNEARRAKIDEYLRTLRGRAEIRIDEAALEELAARRSAAAGSAAGLPAAAGGASSAAPPAVPGAGQ